MANMNSQIYEIMPLTVKDEIPIFSHVNDYIKNYENIATTHITETKKSGRNPFMREELWVELENSTRDIITKYIKKGDKILDVGVGMGRLLSSFTTYDRYGMDISFDYLKIARSKGIEVCLALVEDIPYKKNFFDIIVCTDVLEHVLDLNQTCRNILSVLNDTGFLIVRVPYKENLSQYFQPSCPFEFVHLRNFDEFSLKALFEKILDCQILEYRTIGYAFCRPGLKIRIPFLDIPTVGFVLLTKYISKKFHRFLLKLFFRPAEIEIIIKKKPQQGQV